MLSRIDRFVGQAEVAAAGLLIAVIATAVFLQVWFRYVFHSPLAWTEELSRYLQVWLTAIGAGIGVRLGMHFRLDIIFLVIPSTALRWYRLAIVLASLVFIGMLFWYGIAILQTVRLQHSPAMSVSMAFPYLAIPTGAGLMGFHAIVKVLQALGGEAPVVEEESH
jgi:TRAP-type C4-dicarboxylate transport system permease small subunit